MFFLPSTLHLLIPCGHRNSSSFQEGRRGQKGVRSGRNYPDIWGYQMNSIRLPYNVLYGYIYIDHCVICIIMSIFEMAIMHLSHVALEFPNEYLGVAIVPTTMLVPGGQKTKAASDTLWYEWKMIHLQLISYDLPKKNPWPCSMAMLDYQMVFIAMLGVNFG